MLDGYGYVVRWINDVPGDISFTIGYSKLTFSSYDLAADWAAANRPENQRFEVKRQWMGTER